MKVVVRHQFLRGELDWLAVDADGVVGYFSTAGAGPIPVALADAGEMLWSVPDDVLAMPMRGTAIRIGADEGADITDWLAVAARGLFAYDWSQDNHRYELIARPSSPLIATIENLPAFAVRFADVPAFAVSGDELTAA